MHQPDPQFGSLATKEIAVVDMFLIIFGFAMSLLFDLLLFAFFYGDEEAGDLAKKSRSDCVHEIRSLAST